MRSTNFPTLSLSRYLFGDDYYAGKVLGTYRKQRDWFRVLFDDGANLTVHLDSAREGGAWRMEVPLTAEESRVLAVSALPPPLERLVGRRRRRRRRREQSEVQAEAEADAERGAEAEAEAKEHEGDKEEDEAEKPAPPLPPAVADGEGVGGEVGVVARTPEFLVQLGQDATCHSVWLGDAELENEYPQLHQQLSQKGWDGGGGDNDEGVHGEVRGGKIDSDGGGDGDGGAVRLSTTFSC